MFQFVSRSAQFHMGPEASPPPTPPQDCAQDGTQALQHFLLLLREVGGLKTDNIFCNLRVPNQLQTNRDDINIVIITGHGVFCIDVKPWVGMVSAQKESWHLQLKEEDQHFTNTSIQQVADPLHAIMSKAVNLCSHVKRCGVTLRQSLFLPRVVFLSPHCHLEDALRSREELVSHGDLEAFLRSFSEGYLTWMSDALTPAWITGHLSFKQVGAVRAALGRLGTWDLVRLRGGQQLQGDFQGCQHLTLHRQDTDDVEFHRAGSLPSETLWALLGHPPQVQVKMYQRGARAWLSRPLAGSASIPSTTHIVFRISGEPTDVRIPVQSIHSLRLSM